METGAENTGTAGSRFLIMVAVVSIVMQLPGCFWGVELCDSGFYLTFYEYALKDPAAVGYNYMYPLTGIVGGLLHAIPGLDNLFAMRMVGLVVNTVAAIGAVWLVVRFRPELVWAAFAGVVVVLAGAWDYPLTFYYDHLSSMLMVLGLAIMGYALFCDCKRRSWLLMLVSGIIVGLNAYSRLPNVIDVAVVVVIPLYGLLTGEVRNRLMLPFVEGWFLGVTIGLAIVFCVAGDVFSDIVLQLVDIGSGAGGETSHSIANLLHAQMDAWRRILAVSLLFSAIYVCLRTLLCIRSVFLRGGLLTVLTLACMYMLLKITPVTTVAAFSFAGCAGILLLFREERIPVFYAVSGLVMMILLPMGSDGGIYNGGTVALWLAAVGASCFIVMSAGGRSSRRGRAGLIAMMAFALMFCISAGANLFRRGFYFDPTNIAEMNSEVASPRMRHVYTSARRAALISRILQEASGELEDASEVMVYGSAPMLNYLLHKRPAFGNSWPEQLSEGELRKSLDAYGSEQDKPLPYVVMLKFNTIGSVEFTPSDAFMRGEDESSNIYHNSSKSRVVLDFIDREGYAIVKNDTYFNVYAPPGRLK